MDVISLSKATKAKKFIKKLQDRLGMNGTEQGKDVRDIYANVKTRLEELEKKDPHITLYNRVSEVEANTVINLNKHNLHINSILNKNKYGLTDLAFDDFGDDSGIDYSKSTGHEFDAAGRKVKIANGQTKAEVVTTAEETNVVPRMITVSQAFNEILTGESQVDLVNGTHTNTEVVNGKIQLKLKDVVHGGYNNVTPAMTSNNTPTPYVVSGGGDYTNVYKAFDNSSLTSWYPGTVPTYLTLDFGAGNEKIIKKYKIVANGPSAPKNWTLQASNNNSTWVTLDTQNNITNWSTNFNEFVIDNNQSFRYYKLNFTADNGWGNIKIFNVWFYEEGMFNLYPSTGTYESPVLDLGDNFKDIVRIDQLIDIPSVTTGQTAASVKLYTSTSFDNITFSDWQPVNLDGTIVSPSARYIKIKVELIAGKEEQITDILSSVEYDPSKAIMSNNTYSLRDQNILLKMIPNIHNAAPIEYDEAQVRQESYYFVLNGTYK
ncbi:discoidin domain-containing protein [Parageobacillus galactosidasius]|uniref:F5/8 type C domain-containing protein n=1 Tax=Parageobacillus galactosidasius TaxID=883812 RepID=A0A226QRT1_9BACL|nr:discoidin domain-containing protein [Parageobacillus galactosidasius]OXB94734.1 hypothetical protein B9L23_07675 [Parageobacillus galactosidasius]